MAARMPSSLSGPMYSLPSMKRMGVQRVREGARADEIAAAAGQAESWPSGDVLDE
jgi:hypothetical protein